MGRAFAVGYLLAFVFSRHLLKITTKHTDFKNPVKIAVYG